MNCSILKKITLSWWNFRILDEGAEGPVNVSIYDYWEYEPYRQAVYLRGALFFQAIRDEVGDEAFFDFLYAYYQAAKNRIASAELFFEILEQVTGMNSAPLLNEFFMQ